MHVPLIFSFVVQNGNQNGNSFTSKNSDLDNYMLLCYNFNLIFNNIYK